MKYYAFTRRKSPSTITYGVITVNDPSRLPDKVFDGDWRKGEPWEREGKFNEDNAPYWFDGKNARKSIEEFGYWLVDMAESSRSY